MKIRRILPLATLAFVLAALPATAQNRRDTVEISPYAAYMFGGELLNEHNSSFDGSADVDDDAAWGIRFGYNITDVFQIEMSYLHESTHLVQSSGIFVPDDNLGGLHIDILEGNMLFNMGHHRFRPFFLIGLGATRLDPDSHYLTSDTQFSGSIGGGFKLFFTPEVGMRTDLKYRWSVVDNGGHDYEDCHHDCGSSSDTFGQTEVSVGLVFAF